ncbi:CAZyme family GH43 [Paecilomyces variotii]|uniref:Glycosyl hydrolase n=1 Tax=Byssochlamys spectabilis TaxID=264951 RepID=A0A443HWH1_BYSSP|nr:glycosyl hydrolase [Paecilomyces variotii]KAJ9196084.1 CAZyme family GH43 [Paecilomyces variotii]KAJ9196448.1 CAZyme family GH43 [Paecilomyces variotii]KAJ9220242.1 CAZyme family GH43 [Paecilomyces variotii]KAJ9261424.1 CAZyme family GH43 [Paecilomyces variotii]KAJ9279615.1 CAZyme family GH43 [Paecilomyces variotii]
MSSEASSDIEKRFSGIEPASKQPASRPSKWTWKRIWCITGLAILGAGILAIIITLPIVLRHRGGSSSNDAIPDRPNDPTHPRLAVDNFPDPGLLEHNGTWYAFGTSPVSNVNSTTYAHIPIATSQDFVHWNLTGLDALPIVGAWEAEENHLAPDVIQRDDGRFVLYYGGEVKNWTAHHCVGAAVSNGTSPLGPYHPEDKPLACPKNNGGAIDPSPFRDVDGTLYVTYKVDENSIGHGGNCDNSVKPILPVPIMLQQLESDGVTPVGDPVEILSRDSSDGPLVEAPAIVRTEQGMYYLFFSSNCYNNPAYNVKFAWSQSLKGPYTRASRPLLQTDDYGLRSPGGADVSSDGKKMVFHAYCSATDRCMYAAAIDIRSNETIAFTAV